jgi:hypothetical protein
VGALTSRAAQASGCASNPAFSTCFDANSLWLPAGHASFMSLPDTQVSAVRQVSLGIAIELLHRPVTLHVASPDSDGRDVHAIDAALDASFFMGIGVWKNLELTLAAPMRLYETGTGAAGVTSQNAPPIERNAVRDPRVGLGYSLDNAIAIHGLGLRVAVDGSIPLADDSELAGEGSVVVMPNAALGLQAGPLKLGVSLGARLRHAQDFGDVRLGNQGFVALGLGVDLLDPGLLFLSLEAFGLPSLGSARAPAASAAVTAETLVPAEWLASIHSSFLENGSWTLSLAGGTGIPFSSETRQTMNGTSTTHFIGLSSPDFRALLALRFAPPAPSP